MTDSTERRIRPLDEKGLGNRLVDNYLGHILYCKDEDSLYVWQDGYFRNEKYLLRKQAMSTVEKMKEEEENSNSNTSVRTTDGELVSIDNIASFRKYNRKVSAYDKLLSSAKLDDRILCHEHDMDWHNDLLNVKNGIVNLKSAELIEHSPDYKMTRIANVEYDPQAKCDKWLEFLNTITKGSEGLKHYLQVLAGYLLTGSTAEQKLFVLLGTGANGKTTFVNILFKMLREKHYSRSINPSTLQNISHGKIRSDLARLDKIRLVTSAELQGCSLDESLIKLMTGSSNIVARPLYQSEVEYTPKFKILVDANHPPQIEGNDKGIKRRIVIIPFDATISENEMDMFLEDKLTEELPGIFKWALEGAKQWYDSGLPNCDIITKATEAYYQEMDQTQEFIEDCCDQDPTSRVSIKELYTAYTNWAQENQYSVAPKKQFGAWIRNKGYTQEKSGSQRFWKGLGLKKQSDYVNEVIPSQSGQSVEAESGEPIGAEE